MSEIRTCKGCRYLEGEHPVGQPMFTCLMGCELGILDADTSLPIFNCNHGPFREREPAEPRGEKPPAGNGGPTHPRTEELLERLGEGRILPNDHCLSGWSSEDFNALIHHSFKLEGELDKVKKAAGFCEKHAPKGGARNCLVCACEKLSHALSKISYACGTENEMHQSEYDTHFNEDEVVTQVEVLRSQRDSLSAELSRIEVSSKPAKSRRRERCETCLHPATVHIDALGMHFCKSCLDKIDEKLRAMGEEDRARLSALADNKSAYCDQLRRDLNALRASHKKTKDALSRALGLIVRHHEAGRAPLAWGGFCSVCHRKDGTEPEMDQILEALGPPRDDSAMLCHHCGSGLLWSEDRGAHCDGCDKYNPEESMEKQENLSFGQAIEALKRGQRVFRAGWNGKGMYLWLLPAATVKAEWCREAHLKAMAEANGGEIECLGSIRMMTADKKVLTGWLASQTDMLAEDWSVME